MRSHNANELRERVDILDADGATVVLSNVACGIEDLAGRRLEQAQLIASETTHTIVMRYGDGLLVTASSYLRAADGTLYVVDSRPLDPRKPEPKMWIEIPCHVDGANS